MESDKTISCVICVEAIDLDQESFYEYLGKTICSMCFECLTGGNYKKKSKVQDPQPCVIPRNPSISYNTKEMCNGHQKKYKFYCDSCKLSLCIFCLPLHSEHGFSELETKAKSLLTNLHTIEHLTRYTKSLSECNSNDLDNLLESVLKIFEKIQSRSCSSIIHLLSHQIPQFFTILCQINPDLQGLSLSESQKMIDEGRDLMKEPKKFNWIHWCEWNDRGIHILNLNTMQKSSISLPSPLPFYCKSASLPYQQIFVCGGRAQSNSPGLKSAFIVHLNEKNRVEKVQDMEVGRSNHAVIYFDGFVYVLAGCNELNQYTNKCERLSVPELKWERITSCPEVLDTCSVTSLSESKFLFMTGGRINSQSLTNSVQKLDTVSLVWTKLLIKIPFETSVHGTCFLNSKELLIFSGQDKKSEAVSLSAILNIETGESVILEEKMPKGGCVVNECIEFRSKIYFFIFQGFCSRFLQSFSTESKTWNLEDLN